MSEWSSWIGRTISQRDRLTPALLQRFRATIDSAETGPMAPQAIHWVLGTPEAAPAQLGLAGHPQVNIPGSTAGGLPVGLSIIGARGSDATLVAVAQALEKAA